MAFIPHLLISNDEKYFPPFKAYERNITKKENKLDYLWLLKERKKERKKERNETHF